jgi:predicted DNA-binding transcriptional regulator AlpA
MPKTLNVTDLAQYLGVHRSTAHKIVKGDDFPKPIPALKRWNIEEVDAWRLRSGESAGE